MKIVITGATGFVGKPLVKSLLDKGHSLTVLSRNPNADVPESVEVCSWNGKTVGDWAAKIDGCDAVINLAGEPIAAKRWSETQKEKIVTSRIFGTRAIVQAIEKVQVKPKVLINASATGYYGNVRNEEANESYRKGRGFLADICMQWENVAKDVKAQNVRLVLLRTGIVLEKGGGALEKMIPPFKFFIGGPLGFTGKQWFPWIHRDDLVGLIHFALERDSIEGPLNGVAPHALQMKDFCKVLGKVMHRPSWAPVPGFVLKTLLGEMAEELLLSGVHAIPEKALRNGYEFKYPDAESALEAIIK